VVVPDGVLGIVEGSGVGSTEVGIGVGSIGAGASVIGGGGGFGAITIFLGFVFFFTVRFALFFAPFLAARFLAKQLHRPIVEVPLVINFP
jgi:hypothetical protein